MGQVVKSAQAWILGLISLAVIGGVTLPAKLASLQSGLQARLNDLTTDPKYAGVIAQAKGQDVTLYLSTDYKGTDGQQKLSAAADAILELKGVEGLTRQGGWIYGPVTTVTISPDRMSLAELEVGKVIANAGMQTSQSASSASSQAPVVEDLVSTCNGGIQLALKGRSVDFLGDGHSLTPESNRVLDDVVVSLRNCPSNIRLNVEGLVQPGEDDGQKGPAYKRAQAVADALVLRGYDPYRLSVKMRAATDGAAGDAPVIAFLAVAR